MNRIRAYFPAIFMFLAAYFFVLFPAIAAFLVAGLFLFFGSLYAFFVHQIRKTRKAYAGQGFSGRDPHYEPSFRNVTVLMRDKAGVWVPRDWDSRS